MNRRDFLRAGAGLALTPTEGLATEFQDRKLRAGLIGTRWEEK